MIRLHVVIADFDLWEQLLFEIVVVTTPMINWGYIIFNICKEKGRVIQKENDIEQFNSLCGWHNTY